VQNDGQGNQKLTPISGQQFPRWVPAKARFIVRGRLDPSSPLVSQAYSGKELEGRNDYLDVTFPRNRERVQAKLIRISDQADVAMVKIDMPRAQRKLELMDNYSTIAQGDDIYVLGYPGVSPAVMGAVQSQEALTPSTEVKVIPDPTLSVGNIGRIIRGKAGLTEALYSTFGDVYQLTVNSTGAGNSGGPVMDGQGRVIGLFTYSAQMDALITFAVPIRYGIELMGTKPVM
jgi:serine protease Do